MSDAPAEGAPAPPPPPPPPPPPEGAAQEGAAPEGGAPAGTGPPVLTIDPPIITVPAAGGQSVHQLNNSGGTRLAFKVSF
ncbi:unnamed protein product [Gongylonema pulchrum]|uniref:MSP domain-containing protein n=1 Tax=Gongylonema pulchrum TaxID=637853 RepID=A0A183DJ83_9BILA|nr:unnamed protein product [Gongylonema pulchrum]